MTFCLVALALLGSYLAAYGLLVWDAVLMLGVAAFGLLLVFLRRRERPAGLVLSMGDLVPRTLAGRLRLISLVLSALVGLLTPSLPVGRDFTLWFLLWAVAVLAFATTWLAPWVRGVSLRALLLQREALILMALLAVALALRGIEVGRIPANLGGDEGTQLRAALDLVKQPLGNPFATGWYSVPTMSFLAYGVVMRVLGSTMAGGRWLSVLAGSITVLTTYALGRALGGRRIGWGAALLLTVSAYHIHFSRLASNQIFDPLVGTLALWLVWQGLYCDRPQVRSAGWALGGLVAGLGWYGYFGARWVTVLIALLVTWRCAAEPLGWRRHAPGAATFLLGWLVAVLPLVGWYAAHPSPFTERYNAVGVFSSGWMAREIELSGKTVVTLMLQQIWRSFTAFHLTPDPTFWYRPQAPLVDFATGAALLVGLCAAVTRARWPSRGLVLLWFVSTITLAWVMTENPPSSQRGLLIVPAVMLIAAWGMEATWRLLSRARRAMVALGVLTAAVVLVFNLGFYFGVYTPRRTYGNPTAEAATELSYYLRENQHPACDGSDAPCTASVQFFGPPFQYWGFGVYAFLLPDVQGFDVVAGELPEAVSSPVRFVFVAERAAELDALILLYPGGVVSRVLASDGRNLALIYDW